MLLLENNMNNLEIDYKKIQFKIHDNMRELSESTYSLSNL